MRDRWVRMTAAEYADYTANRPRVQPDYSIGFEDGYKHGLDVGYERGRLDEHRLAQALAHNYDEQENDENFNG